MSVKPANPRDRVFRAMDGLEVDRPPLMPITMMFAARRIGRIYHDYVTDYRVLVESQVRTAEMFDFDYVTTCSDPTRETCDCGGAVKFYEDQPPAIIEDGALLADKATLATLKVPDPYAGGRMLDRIKAVELFRQRVGGERLIEGWIEGPLASACALRGINATMLDCIDDPDFLRDLFAFCVELELSFAKAQVDAGADSIAIGDAAASLIGPQLYKELLWPYQKQMVDGLREMNTRIRLHICGNTKDLFEGMAALDCDILDLDSMAPLADARRRMGPDQLLLGNVDPVVILQDGTPELVFTSLRQCRDAAGKSYVVGAGCEVPQATPPENVAAMRDFAQSV